MDLIALLEEHPAPFPLQSEIRPTFAAMIRYLGVMAYQFLDFRGDRQLVKGLRVDNRTFRFSPVQTLKNSKVLRDRGIKVIGASFADLDPGEKIRQERVKNWMALWDQITESQLAPIKSDADDKLVRACATRFAAMISNLLVELRKKQVEEYADDILYGMIISKLEEIEQYAAKSSLLPEDTIRTMETLQARLSPPKNTDKA